MRILAAFGHSHFRVREYLDDVQIPGLRTALHESEWVLVHDVGVNEVLTQSLAPILRDVEASGFDAPRVEDKSWTDDPDVGSAMLWSLTGSGMGIQVRLTAPEAERVATVADQVQEWVIEELWSSAPTNWPPCPAHPNGHPLKAVALDVATWVCPADRSPVAPVGALHRVAGRNKRGGSASRP